MSSKNANVKLASFDDIFSTEESREAAGREQVQDIPLSELHPFEGHPFRVVDDEAMTRTVESISKYGVIAPLLARPDPDGGYEIISGHRRCHAAELIGLETLPVIVREMDDDEAIIAMVDANLQRETILPSERAWAYKMKLDAIKHQGARTDLILAQVGPKLSAADKVALEADDSRSQVKRYIRLTNLIPELMDMVDEKKIAFNPAVEISYLSREEQENLLEAMDYAQASPSLSQGQRLKKMSQERNCTPEAMRSVMNEVKKGDLERVTFNTNELRKYFPKSYTSRQMEDTILRLLEQWQKKRNREQAR
ncbi:MAG: ParB/RepB/Spo0J family partition protein [Clostridiales bacterium]|nr:ParB/RepB/Spo0J family partition protein [Clostridiales bacterium]